MGAVQEDENLFENHIFEQIHLAVNSPELPHFLKVRPLRISDYQRGYCDLLSQLTVIGNLTENCFRERFHLMRNANPSSYYIIVIEDSSVGKVVASGTLTVEFKFIHNGSCRGRIEDIVVDEKMRGKKLGRMLLIYLVALARFIGTYKISLECTENLIPFYEQFGFSRDKNFYLQQRY